MFDPNSRPRTADKDIERDLAAVFQFDACWDDACDVGVLKVTLGGTVSVDNILSFCYPRYLRTEPLDILDLE